MVYITGDCHAEFTKFTMKNFPEQREMTRDDYVIVLGDFGGLWHDTKEERYWLKWLAQKKFTLLFIDGNHENFDRLYSKEFPVVDFHGGKAHRIRKNIYHLMRGYIFDLDGKKFFAFGGAKSHDIQDGILDIKNFNSVKELNFVANLWELQGKMFRINHVSWWKKELPTKEEMELATKNLKKNKNKVDYVITHCLPQSIVSFMYGAKTDSDVLTRYFQRLIDTGLTFKEWHCGHYHKTERYLGQYYIHYYDIVRLL